jgi:hypothetical protein
VTEIDFEFEGAQQTFEAFQELRERYEGDGITLIVGTTVKYGIFLEMGTEDMPPYPWFRPAVREFKANPEQFLFDNTDFNAISEIETTEELVTAVATALQTQMEDNVNAQDPSRDRSPGTKPDHPSRDTGNLTASIMSVRIA